MKKLFLLVLISLSISCLYSQSDTIGVQVKGVKISIGESYIFYGKDQVPNEGLIKAINKSKILIYSNYEFQEILIVDINHIEKSNSHSEMYKTTKDAEYISKKNTFLTFGILYRQSLKKDVNSSGLISYSNTFGLKNSITHYFHKSIGITAALDLYHIPDYTQVIKNYDGNYTRSYSQMYAGRLSGGMVFGQYKYTNPYNFEFKGMIGFTVANYKMQDMYNYHNTPVYWDVYLGFNNSVRLSSSTRIYVEPAYIIELFSQPSVFTISGGLQLYL